MIEGTLSYTKNGIYLGIAFRDAELRKGKLYPAVAAIFNEDSFSIIKPMPED